MLYTGLTTHKQPSCYNTSNCCLRRFWNRASIWQCNTMANVVVTNTFSADQGCPWHVHTKLCSSPLLSVWITAICMHKASIKLSEYQTFWRRWPSKIFLCMQQWRQSCFDWLPKAMGFCPCPLYNLLSRASHDLSVPTHPFTCYLDFLLENWSHYCSTGEGFMAERVSPWQQDKATFICEDWVTN